MKPRRSISIEEIRAVVVCVVAFSLLALLLLADVCVKRFKSVSDHSRIDQEQPLELR